MGEIRTLNRISVGKFNGVHLLADLYIYEGLIKWIIKKYDKNVWAEHEVNPEILIQRHKPHQ
jgi:cytochrome b subunit of formate dehydrogenase